MNMALVKRQDFVEIEYTGIIKENGTIFDTTKDSPAVICIGSNHVLNGLEEQLIGKETGKEYKIELSPENAFGRRNAKLIQLIPLNKFRQQNIEPMPGLQLNIDGLFGVIKTVSGGRCLVDFNHPLAGRDVIYHIKINRIVNEDKEKLNSILKMQFHIKDAEIEIKEGGAYVKSKHNIPEQAQEEFRNIVHATIPSIKKIEFT